MGMFANHLTATGNEGADKVAELTWYLSRLNPSLLLVLVTAFHNEPSNLLNQQKTFFLFFFFPD